MPRRASLVAGLIFGLGLILSGMGNPAKVQNFLDFFGTWDPSLALVMVGAIAVGLVAFTWAKRRKTALLGEPMQLPKATKIDTRLLLGSVAGLTLAEMADTEVCCGFGGSFCVSYPEISGRMADDKRARVAETGADTLLGGDLGCLLHLAGRMQRCGSSVKVFHTAEVLAGMADGAGIGGAKEPQK